MKPQSHWLNAWTMAGVVLACTGHWWGFVICAVLAAGHWVALDFE